MVYKVLLVFRYVFMFYEVLCVFDIYIHVLTCYIFLNLFMLFIRFVFNIFIINVVRFCLLPVGTACCCAWCLLCVCVCGNCIIKALLCVAMVCVEMVCEWRWCVNVLLPL